LQSNDEFFILACDGIWDCLTNIQAVKYVRERIDTMSPTEIGAKMLDEIISDDPRATQGIGGDNMTILIVDLLPGKRSYRNKTSTGEDK
jgi:serine/threonine protein phosphatase PrpC